MPGRLESHAMSIRHREASRLEGFSDAVFGFALTLLVVALETPKTIEELKALTTQLVPFAVTFEPKRSLIVYVFVTTIPSLSTIVKCVVSVGSLAATFPWPISMLVDALLA